MSKKLENCPTTTTTTTHSGQEAGSHRSCPRCRKRMSTLKYDSHTICFKCREDKCDLNNRCKECRDWSEDKMEDYLKHRRSLESKSKPKTDTVGSLASTSTTTSSSITESDYIREMEKCT